MLHHHNLDNLFQCFLSLSSRSSEAIQQRALNLGGKLAEVGRDAALLSEGGHLRVVRVLSVGAGLLHSDKVGEGHVDRLQHHHLSVAVHLRALVHVGKVALHAEHGTQPRRQSTDHRDESHRLQDAGLSTRAGYNICRYNVGT